MRFYKIIIMLAEAISEVTLSVTATIGSQIMTFADVDEIFRGEEQCNIHKGGISHNHRLLFLYISYTIYFLYCIFLSRFFFCLGKHF